MDEKNEALLSEKKVIFSVLEGLVPQIGYSVLHASERYGKYEWLWI